MVQRRKGYGFIQREDGGPDVFVHYSEIVGSGYRSLEEGQKVEFELRDGAASNIMALSGSQSIFGEGKRVARRVPPEVSVAGPIIGTDDATEPARVQEFVVQVYLESADGAGEVDRRVLELLRAMHAEVGSRPPPVIGSWFRQFRAKIRQSAGIDPLEDLALRIERALELKTLHGPQA